MDRIDGLLLKLSSSFPERFQQTNLLIKTYGRREYVVDSLYTLYSADVSYLGCRICVSNGMDPDKFVRLLRGYDY